MREIWVLGSYNVDLVVKVATFPKPGETIHGTAFNTFLGGKGGNQAMALARLGAAPHVAGCVGADDFGEQYRREMERHGANTASLARIPDTPTGTALIEVAGNGENHIVIVSGANGSATPEFAVETVRGIPRNSILLLQQEIPLGTVHAAIREAHSRDIGVILDPAPAATIPGDILPLIDWLTPNETEAATILGIQKIDSYEEAGIKLREAGARNVIVKAGVRGAYLVSADHPVGLHVPGFSVKAIDTTAAGDSFNGGFAWALAAGKIPDEAVRIANAVAAISVTQLGAQTAMPNFSQLEAFLMEK